MMRRSLQPLREAQGSARVQRDPHLARVAGEDPRVVARRGEEAGDHQLPDLQAGTRRPLLRQDLRAGQGLRVQLRQVQAHEAPRRRLREVRRRGDPVQGAPRAHGPHHAGHAGRAHLVPEVLPSRIGNLLDITLKDLEKVLYFESLHRHRPEARPICKRGELLSERALLEAQRASTAATRFEAAWAPRRSASCSRTLDVEGESQAPARRDARGHQRGEAQEARQAPQGARGVPRVGQQARSG